MLPGWSSILIAGKAVDLFTPTEPPRFALIYLHPVGLELLSTNTTYTALLQHHAITCAAPHGERSWWADRVCPDFDPAMTPEAFLLNEMEPRVRQIWGWGSRPIGIFGISMGGQGAIRFALKYPERFPVAAGVASAFDYYEWYGQGTVIDQMYTSREACRQDTALLHVNPSKFPPHLWFACDPQDPWHRGNDRLHEKLTAMGIPHTADLETSCGGHTWIYFDSMAPRVLAFLMEAITKQSRKLL